MIQNRNVTCGTLATSSDLFSCIFSSENILFASDASSFMRATVARRSRGPKPVCAGAASESRLDFWSSYDLNNAYTSEKSRTFPC